MTKLSVSVIASFIGLSLVAACSSGVDDLRQDRRLGISSDAISDDTADGLVLPHQTTGSFLTMSCKWSQREGYSDNKIKCRFEGEGGVKAYSKSLDLDAYSGDKVSLLSFF